MTVSKLFCFEVLLFLISIKALLYHSALLHTHTVIGGSRARSLTLHLQKVAISQTRTGIIRTQEVVCVSLGGSLRQLHPSVEANPTACEGPAEEPTTAI